MRFPSMEIALTTGWARASNPGQRIEPRRKIKRKRKTPLKIFGPLLHQTQFVVEMNSALCPEGVVFKVDPFIRGMSVFSGKTKSEQ